VKNVNVLYKKINTSAKNTTILIKSMGQYKKIFMKYLIQKENKTVMTAYISLRCSRSKLSYSHNLLYCVQYSFCLFRALRCKMWYVYKNYVCENFSAGEIDTPTILNYFHYFKNY